MAIDPRLLSDLTLPMALGADESTDVRLGVRFGVMVRGISSWIHVTI